MRQPISAHTNIQKLIPNVSPKYREQLDIPEDHESVGLISCDNEEVLNLALDDATKKARIRVSHVQSAYVGGRNSANIFKDASMAIISGPKVQDVKSGLSHIEDYVNRHCCHYASQSDPEITYYAAWTPRAGLYMRDRLGVPEGTAYCLLSSTPMESTYALDAAMKASNTELAEMSEIFTSDNKIFAFLTGTESACRSAVEAYCAAIDRFAANPMTLEV